ncbi:MAG: hypothetical protein ACRDJF_06850 [Actinomycetota bacterium]
MLIPPDDFQRHVRGVIGRAFVIHEMADNFGNVPVGSGPAQYTPNTTGTGPETATGLTAATGNAGRPQGLRGHEGDVAPGGPRPPQQSPLARPAAITV